MLKAITATITYMIKNSTVKNKINNSQIFVTGQDIDLKLLVLFPPPSPLKVTS